MIIATEYMGIPIRIESDVQGIAASLIWTLRHPFVSLARLNQEMARLEIVPQSVDIVPGIDAYGPHILIMADCFA